MKTEKQEIARADLSAILVIFGGTGDLTHRKLMPALYNLIKDQLIPEQFAVVSVGRRDKTQEEYRQEIFESVSKYSRNKLDKKLWVKLKEMIHY